MDHIVLEPVQQELFVVIVEASRNVPRDRLQPFLVSPIPQTGQSQLIHDGFPGGRYVCLYSDVEVLKRENLLVGASPGMPPLSFSVVPFGLKYYEWYKQKVGEPTQRIEASIRAYMTNEIRQRYPQAHDKWITAETKVWKEHVEDLSVIGLLCREAMQEFANALVDRHQPPAVDQDPSRDIKRVGTVLMHLFRDRLTTERDVIDAAMEYWAKVIALTQRSKHGASKEGEPLIWADARAVVFHTCFMMHEIDRLVSRARSGS